MARRQAFRARHFLLIAALVQPIPLRAQTATAHASLDSVVVVFKRWADMYGGRLVQAFDSIPADRYAYRPTPAQQSIGYVAQHLEDANYGLCERFGPLKHSPAARDSLADTLKALWPKDTLVRRLHASLEFCDAALERAGPLRSAVLADNLVAFETDLAEHYSQIAGYMRQLGMVPPSALPPRHRTPIELPASELRAFLGTYQLAPGLELDVTMSGDTLFVQSSVRHVLVHLWPESQTGFFVEGADVQVDFARDTTGNVAGLVLRQNGHERYAAKVGTRHRFGNASR